VQFEELVIPLFKRNPLLLQRKEVDANGCQLSLRAESMFLMVRT